MLAKIKRLEDNIAAAEAELAGLTREPLSDFELRVLRRRAHEVVGRFKDAMYADIPIARQALRKLLSGPLRFVPEGGHYVIHGTTAADQVLAASLELASPRGFEPLFAP